MLKIKLKHTNLLDFVSSSLFCLENDKLSWKSYWHKHSSCNCIHISALQSRKLRLRESTRLILSSLLLLGFASLNVPPWLLSKTFLYTLRAFQNNRILTMSIFSPVILNRGADKDYIVQISGKDLILSIVPETYSLVCTS